jgi:hypothetical protein
MMTEEQMDQFEYDMLMADDNLIKENTMLERIKNIGEKISEIIQGLMGVALSIMILIFSGMIIVGFITLCLGAL